ncbi:hypothetical protein M885DRAFT_521731 [Pelagophyceae sp. CCMP2097]|nr:hypothetical protein M885DRAFT_521731 [Pelagophyceae sp. CCMP2097]|mmetsp:Transcript_2138/g.7595  ORF Transcript_2138/g.7595 Transcript_2138/m.7595 type:complete len:184 (+) Transcript_2138:77-628(+)
MSLAVVIAVVLAGSSSALAPELRGAPLERRSAPLGRRQVLTAGCLATAALAPPPSRAALGGREQWDAAVEQVDLLAAADFDTLAGGGDAVRRVLGTVGSTSPLFQIEKAARKLLPEAADPEQFGDALEEFLLALGRADSMAYASIFAGGSGNPALNSPKALMAKAKREVKALQAEARRMTAAL